MSHVHEKGETVENSKCRNGEAVLFVQALACAAMEQHGIPEQVALAARRSTLRNLGCASSPRLDARDYSRMRAYFWAVIRRRSVRDRERGMKPFRDRIVVQSIIDDLRESGRDAEGIARELELSVAGCVSPDVVAEARFRLCGLSAVS